MSTLPQPAWTKSRIGWCALGLVAFLGILIGGIHIQRHNAARKPQLDIKNAGAAPVTIRYSDQIFVAQPGKTWHTRVKIGDSMILYAGESETARSRTILLDGHRLSAGLPPRLEIEVRTDAQTNILVDFVHDEMARH